MTGEPARPPARASGGGSMLGAAGAMGVATFLSRIFGLIREQAIAIVFGAGNATDAYTIAFRIPNLLRDLFAEGAMSSALVPTFTRAREIDGVERAWQVAGRVFIALFVLVGALSIAGIIWAPGLVELYASHYHTVPGKFELTLRMTRIMFPFFPLIALAAAFMGILNAVGVFFLPAFASALFNIASVSSGLLLSLAVPRIGLEPIEGMAIGVVIGGAVQAFCQWPSLTKKGFHWVARRAGDPSWRSDPAFKRMLVLMVPGTVGLAATQVNILVNSVLATSQGTGAVSWLNFAFRLVQLPIGVFGVSLASASLPRVSKLWVQGRPQEVADELAFGLRTVFSVNIPAAAGLMALGVPIVGAIFEHGRFGPSDTVATAGALAMYSIGLAGFSGVKVLVPAFYALEASRIAVISSVLTVGINLGLNTWLVGTTGFRGLALGTALTAYFNLGFLIVSLGFILKRKNSRFPFESAIRACVAQLALASAMGLACYGAYRALSGWLPTLGWDRRSIHFLSIGLLIPLSVFFLLALARVFGVRDTLSAFETVRERIQRRFTRP